MLIIVHHGGKKKYVKLEEVCFSVQSSKSF
ncbi:hypothetical protein R3I93_008379 [Phoxinus phoxinus]|uniref:Uncharacterized protein n=1 Tax=Phoxinus phoxinus TaxID=58324 RepID=A0AAN9D6C2_9TELE